MSKNTQETLKKHQPKQVWPIQAPDGVIRSIEDYDHILKYFHSKDADKFRATLKGGRKFDPEKLRAENHERQKDYAIEDIIDFVVEDFYSKIRGIYENNEDMSIFQAIEDAHGIIQCNNYASYPNYILDALAYSDHINNKEGK